MNMNPNGNKWDGTVYIPYISLMIMENDKSYFLHNGEKYDWTEENYRKLLNNELTTPDNIVY